MESQRVGRDLATEQQQLSKKCLCQAFHIKALMGVSVQGLWVWKSDNLEFGDALTSFNLGKLFNHLFFPSVKKCYDG